MRARISGVRTAADVAAASAANPTAVGVICGSDPHAVAPDVAAALIGALPPHVSGAVTTDLTDPVEILALAERVGATTIEVGGDLTDDELCRLYEERGSRTIVRRVRVHGHRTMTVARGEFRCCDALLLDARTPDSLGGPGRGGDRDWTFAAAIVRDAHAHGVRAYLTGSLDAETVGTAIMVVRPDGVSANRGLDDAGGAKDAGRCRAFVSAALGAAATLGTEPTA